MRFVRGAGFWLLAFVFAYAIWLWHDDSAKLPELLAGIVVAALAATATELVRRQRVAQIDLRVGGYRRIPLLFLSAARDCATLTIAAFAQLLDPKPARGETVSLPFRGGGDTPRANGKRAIALGVGSFAPGTIVVGVDGENDVLIAHQLASKPTTSNLDPLELG